MKDSSVPNVLQSSSQKATLVRLHKLHAKPKLIVLA